MMRSAILGGWSCRASVSGIFFTMVGDLKFYLFVDGAERRNKLQSLHEKLFKSMVISHLVDLKPTKSDKKGSAISS